MNTQQAAKWFGIVLLAVGILGFIPGVVTANYLLLGIFQVDAMHNVIHIVSGVIGIASAASFNGSKLYFKIFGIVYGIVTILGFIGGGMVLGMVMNMADNILHLVITAFSLYYGFRGEGGSARS